MGCRCTCRVFSAHVADDAGAHVMLQVILCCSCFCTAAAVLLVLLQLLHCCCTGAVGQSSSLLPCSTYITDPCGRAAEPPCCNAVTLVHTAALGIRPRCATQPRCSGALPFAMLHGTHHTQVCCTAALSTLSCCTRPSSAALALHTLHSALGLPHLDLSSWRSALSIHHLPFIPRHSPYSRCSSNSRRCYVWPCGAECTWHVHLALDTRHLALCNAVGRAASVQHVAHAAMSRCTCCSV